MIGAIEKQNSWKGRYDRKWSGVLSRLVRKGISEKVA
jgi:hypothetical protein